MTFKAVVFHLLIAASLVSSHATAASSTQSHGTILLYHHVSEDTPPSTSISPDNFSAHMQHLADNHTVVPLLDMINAIKNGDKIADNAVAITFDDGYQNILHNGHPILKEHGFSYTIFINPDLIGQLSQQLTWEQVRQMQQEGVTFANHTSQHEHLLTGSTTNPQKWLDETLADIDRAEKALKRETGNQHKLLAYPYGEFNLALQQAIAERGYVGFGQQSGAVAPYSDLSALPRIPAAGIYANLDTLKVKLSALAMPVTDKTIKDPQLSFESRRPTQKLQVQTDDFDPRLLACYLNSQSLELKWQQQTVEIVLQEDLPVGRSRINCTAPSKQQPGQYYWYSQPWFVPTEKGKWLD